MRFWKKKDNGPYPRSFAKRLTWRIMLMLLFVMGITSAIVVLIGWSIALAGISFFCDSRLDYKAKSVEQTLSEVYVATVNTIPDIEGNLPRPDRMRDIMKRVVELNPHIRSCGISFREGYYPQKGRWFCPYAQRSDSDSIVIMNTIGGQEQDYLHADWFQEAMKAKEGYWSKPFFDGKDKTTPLVAYLAPIRDERGSTVAVLGVDISLEMLANNILRKDTFKMDSTKKWTAEKEVYYFIADSSGTFLVHPDKERIIRQNFLDVVKPSEDYPDNDIGKKILKDNESDFQKNGKDIDALFIDDEEVTVTYTSLEHTPWKMVFVLPTFFLELAGYIVGGLLLFFILIGLIVVFFVGRRGIKKSSQPLKQLAASANEVAKGNFDTHLPDIKSRDEIHQLRDSFDNMQHSLNRYVSELRDTTAQKASMESELKIAHDIQMDMLPKTFPPYPEREDIDIYGSLTPAKAVGGDLFDFYIHDNQLFFCIGDVSGKGVPSSLFMAVTRSLFRNISAHVAFPERIMFALNNALTDSNETNMFVTLFTGVLNLTTGYLRYCNAGHNSPLLVGRDVGELPCLPNLPLGIVADFQFQAQGTDIDPQTTIFLFTDGLSEAEDEYHAQFGNKRIHQVATRLLSHRQHQPQELIQQMLQEVHDFVGGAVQSDDLTMLAVQYKPKG